MRAFELNRNVDAVKVVGNNTSSSLAPAHQALYAPVAAYPVAVAAYTYVAAATQVAIGYAYWVGVGINYYFWGPS